MSAADNHNSTSPEPSHTLKKWLKCVPHSAASEIARQAIAGRLLHIPNILGRVIEHSVSLPDEVRQLRVATRRASTAVNTFAEFAAPAMAMQVTRDLKKIRKAAGRIRDLDVLIDHMQTRNPQSASLPTLRMRRFVAQAKIEKSYYKFIESGRFHANTQQLLNSLPAEQNDDLSIPFEAWARQNLAMLGTSFFASWPLTESSAGDNFVALHNFRLLVKKLRYEVELLGAATPKKPKKKFHRKLKALQTSLGQVNDHDVAIQKIHSWLRNAVDEKRTALQAQLESEYAARAVAIDKFYAHWNAESLIKLKQTFDTMLSKRSTNEAIRTA